MERQPLAEGVIGFMDGVSFLVECPSEEVIQNAYYDGYQCDTTINYIMVFGPDDKVFFGCLNFPGSWHDSMLLGTMLEFIIDSLDIDKKICVDQGFSRDGSAVLVGPISNRAARKLSAVVKDLLMRRANAYTSLRQSAEWGMRGLQGSFPRLKSRLQNSEKRYNVILSILLIHNFRTSIVGLNQILFTKNRLTCLDMIGLEDIIFM